MFRTLILIVLTTLVSACSMSKVKTRGFEYTGVLGERPENGAKAYSIAKEADLRETVSLYHMKMDLELQRQFIECSKTNNTDCMNYLSLMGYGMGWYGGGLDGTLVNPFAEWMDWMNRPR